MTSPLRERFGIFHHLEFYNTDELTRIIRNSAKKLSVTIDEQAAGEIARRARGTPRIANRLLRRVRDFVQVKTSANKIDEKNVQEAMTTLRIDTIGLDDVDRRLIQTIYQFYKGGPVGIETLSATLNEEIDTIEDVVEPYLLKIGFLKRTPRGRELTESSIKHIQSARS